MAISRKSVSMSMNARKASSNSRSVSKGSKLTECRKGLNSFVYDAFSYSTVRSATIKSHGVGVVYRLAQLLLLFYIIG